MRRRNSIFYHPEHEQQKYLFSFSSRALFETLILFCNSKNYHLKLANKFIICCHTTQSRTTTEINK